MAIDKNVVSWDLIVPFIEDAFVGVGVPREDAEICADVLLESDRRGIESHGVNRFKPIYYDRIIDGVQQPVTNFEVVKKTFTTAVVDGHDGMGQVIGKKSMELAIEMAKQYGMGCVAAKNSTHFGIAGYYATMATKAGCVGFVGTNARPSTAPTFGVENMMGTNPFTIGLPTDEEFDFLLDGATSLTQRGKVEYYERLGLPTPGGAVIDQDGNIMTDSAAILRGLSDGTAALTTIGGAGEALGGYKGYGFASAVEILSAAFTASSFMRMLTGIRDGEKVPFHLGHYFIAIDTAAFDGEESFRKTAGSICRELRASKKAKGHDRIYTPGEKEYLAWQARKNVGVAINASVQKELIAVRDGQGLSKYRFPFE
jgi:LDH2 family malate/lactate/ureidoglycolate dehydrogenase